MSMDRGHSNIPIGGPDLHITYYYLTGNFFSDHTYATSGWWESLMITSKGEKQLSLDDGFR